MCTGTWVDSQDNSWVGMWHCVKCKGEWVSSENDPRTKEVVWGEEPIHSKNDVEKVRKHWVENPECFD